jgi:hypothetical protein
MHVQIMLLSLSEVNIYSDRLSFMIPGRENWHEELMERDTRPVCRWMLR